MEVPKEAMLTADELDLVLEFMKHIYDNAMKTNAVKVVDEFRGSSSIFGNNLKMSEVKELSKRMAKEIINNPAIPEEVKDFVRNLEKQEDAATADTVKHARKIIDDKRQLIKNVIEKMSHQKVVLKLHSNEV